MCLNDEQYFFVKFCPHVILVPFSFYFPLQVQLDFFSCILHTHGGTCWDTNLVSAKQKEILAADTFNHHMALEKFKSLFAQTVS